MDDVSEKVDGLVRHSHIRRDTCLCAVPSLPFTMIFQLLATQALSLFCVFLLKFDILSH